MTTLETIRFNTEQYTQDTLTNESIVLWCTDLNAELGVSISLPATGTIALTTTELEYTLPADLKQIIRLWLQSDKDNGYDRQFTYPYRIFNGKLILHKPFWQADTLIIEYAKQLKAFTNISDEIDFDDRYDPLYSSYCLMQYYDSPVALSKLGEQVARREYEKTYARHATIRGRLVSLYSLNDEPVVVDERW